MSRMFLGMAVAGLLLLGGCRKDLCYNHAEHALTSRMEVLAEWELEWERMMEGERDWEAAWKAWEDGWFGMEYDDLRPEAGGGLRVCVYTGDDRESEVNLDSTGGTVHVSPGEHNVLLYNNDTEYITFHETDSWATATASTRTRTRTRAGGTVLEGKTPPDNLFGAYVEGFVAERSDTAKVLPVVMQPLTHTYAIFMRFRGGTEHIRLARGALSGMAVSVFLQDGRVSEEDGTLLFDEECVVEEGHGVWALVRSFGVAGTANGYYGTKSGVRHVLELEVVLGNGKTKLFEADVTEQVSGQTRGGVVYVDEGWEVTDEEAAGGNGGGFDVDIDGWGDYVDVILPLD